MPQKMFRLTDEQICKLKKVSELRGCSQTDLIRGFIDSLDEEPPDTQGDTHRDTQEIHGDERSSGADSPALAALIDQLAKKDEQIAKLMETVADSTKAVQGAQALHHETAQTLALESAAVILPHWPPRETFTALRSGCRGVYNNCIDNIRPVKARL